MLEHRRRQRDESVAVVPGPGRSRNPRRVRHQQTARRSGQDVFILEQRGERAEDLQRGRIGLSLGIALLDLAVRPGLGQRTIEVIAEDDADDPRVILEPREVDRVAALLLDDVIHITARTGIGGQVDVAIEIQPLSCGLGRRRFGDAEEGLVSLRQLQLVDEELGGRRRAFGIDIGEMAGEPEIHADQARERDTLGGLAIDRVRSRLHTDHLGRDDLRAHVAVVVPLRGDDLLRLARRALDVERLGLLDPSDEGVIRHAVCPRFDLFRVDQGERLAGERSPRRGQHDGPRIVVVVRGPRVQLDRSLDVDPRIVEQAHRILLALVWRRA